MIRGRLVDLTAIERADLPRLLEWRNTPELRRHFREYRDLSMTHQERWFERSQSDPTVVMRAIRRQADGELLGCCGLVYIHWVNRSAELSLYIGHGNAYIDGDGYAEDAARALLGHAFAGLGLHRVWVEVYAFDEAKRALLEQLGFTLEGTLREHHFRDGRFYQGEYYFLLLTSFLGCLLMPSSRDLLMLFISLELVSAPGFLIAAFRKSDPRSNEAGIKFFLIGVLSTAVMLYGMSLVYGVTGSLNLEQIATALSAALPQGQETLVQAAILFIVAGFAFRRHSSPPGTP